MESVARAPKIHRNSGPGMLISRSIGFMVTPPRFEPTCYQHTRQGVAEALREALRKRLLLCGDLEIDLLDVVGVRAEGAAVGTIRNGLQQVLVGIVAVGNGENAY